MTSDYSLSDAFKAIEDELIASMMRNIDHHRAEEDEQGINWTMWQSEQLRSLEQYKQSLEGYKEKFADINSQIDRLIRTANKTGSMEQEVEILEAIKQGFSATKVSSGLSAKFFALNERKLEALITATVSDMEKAEYAILRKSEDAYRKVIYNAQVYANTGAGTYEKAVDMATKDMLSAGLTCVQYKNGAVHTLADYADMAIRTASKRAYLQGEGAMRQEWGIHTVIVNKRINPCPHCLPFCGKVFIDDVWSGGTKKDGDYPLLSTAIAAGLYHPRCKDAHSTYFPGISSEPEKTYTKKELKTIEKNEAREARQQYAQRQADKYGRLSKYSLDNENQQKYAAASERYGEAASSLNTGTSTTQGTLEELFDGSLETMERQLDEVSEKLEEIKSIDLDEYEKSLKTDKKYLRTMGDNGINNNDGGNKVSTAKDAATIGEAKEYARNVLGFSTCDYEEFNLDVANMANEEVAKLYAIFGNVNQAGYLDGIRWYPDEAKWTAGYSPDFREVLMRNVTSDKSLSEMAAIAQKNHSLGFWSTGEAEHVLRHELGHSIQLWFTDSNAERLPEITALRESIMRKCGITSWSAYDSDEHMRAAGEYLSYYGLETDGEFIAESVAEYMNGNARETAIQVINILLGKD